MLWELMRYVNTVCWTRSATTALLLVAFTSTLTSSKGLIDVDSTDGGYRQVVVAISSKVPENNAHQLITSIKEAFRNTSKKLHEATGRRLWYKDIVILLPTEWLDESVQDLNLEPAGLESYDDAEIRITPGNNIYSYLYTHQTSGCGQPGRYTQIDPQFLTQNESNPEIGRLLVREWSHLRFGVFAEHGHLGDPLYPGYYFKDGHRARPTGCTNREIVGKNLNVKTGGSCEENHRTGLPDGNCVFVASKNSGENQLVESSLMDQWTHLPNVDHFCGGDDGHRHDRFSPTKQNNLCNGRSVWQVLQTTEDFQKAPKTGQDLDPTATKFRIMKTKKSKYILAVDTSNKRSDYLRDMTFYKATSKALKYYFPIGSSVGIVEYSSPEKTQTKVGMTELKSQDDRDKVSENVPDLATNLQQQCVICAVTQGIQVLGSDAAGSNLILLTDGNLRNAKLEEVRRLVKRSRVRLFPILYPNPGQKSVIWQKLARESNGEVFVIDEPRKSKDGSSVTVMELEAAYLSILGRTSPSHMTPVIVMQHIKELSKQVARSGIHVPSSKYNLPRNGESGPSSGSLISGIFSLDVPSNLVFSVYYYKRGNIAEDLTRLIGPSSSYDGRNLKKEKYISTVLFLVDNAENGTWRYEVVGTPPTQQPLIVTATATPLPSPDSNSQPIAIKGWMNIDGKVNPATKPVILQVQLKKGDYPVIGAKVVATVEIITNNMMQQMVQPPPILLRDNGNGDADITADDGVYSAYFTHFYNASRYNVRIRAQDIPGTSVNTPFAEYSYYDNDESFSSVGGGREDCCGSRVARQKLEPTGSFTKEYNMGSFSISNRMEGDNFPPGRIGNFQILQKWTNIPNRAGTLVTFRWTAPGDDYDYGRAMEYELRYSRSLQELEDGFDGAGVRVKEDYRGRPLEPLQSGTLQNVTINMPAVDSDVVYYAAIRAKDEDVNRRSKLSNIVQVMVKRTPKMPPTPQPGKTGPPTPTEELIKTGKKLGPDNDEKAMAANWTIIMVVVIAFVVFVAIISIVIYLLFRRRKEPHRCPPNPAQTTIIAATTKPAIYDKAAIVAQYGGPDPHTDYTMSPVQSWPASTLLNHYDKVEAARMHNRPPPIMMYADGNESDVKVAVDEEGSEGQEGSSNRSSLSTNEKDEKIRLDTSNEMTSSTPSLTPSANLSLRRVTQV